MIVQVFLAGLAFSIQQQQVKKGKGGSCLVDQVKHLVYNNGQESATLKLTTIHSEKRVPALKSFES